RLIRRATGTSIVLAVDVQGVTRVALPREVRRARSRASAKPLAQLLVTQELNERVAERVLNVRLDEQPGVADDLLDGTRAVPDHRRPRRQRLERREPEP